MVLLHEDLVPKTRLIQFTAFQDEIDGHTKIDGPLLAGADGGGAIMDTIKCQSRPVK